MTVTDWRTVASEDWDTEARAVEESALEELDLELNVTRTGDGEVLVECLDEFRAKSFTSLEDATRWLWREFGDE